MLVTYLLLLSFHPAERMRLEVDHFYSEVAVMTKVSTGAHPNVISMVGCIIEKPYPAVVMEYAPLGNLHSFLLKYKNEVRSNLPGLCFVVGPNLCLLHLSCSISPLSSPALWSCLLSVTSSQSSRATTTHSLWSLRMFCTLGVRLPQGW